MFFKDSPVEYLVNKLSRARELKRDTARLEKIIRMAQKLV